MPAQAQFQQRELCALPMLLAPLEILAKLVLVLVGFKVEVIKFIMLRLRRSKLRMRYFFSDVGFFDLCSGFPDG